MRWLGVAFVVIALGMPARAEPTLAAAKQLHADAQAADRLCAPTDAACKANTIPAFEAAERAYAELIARGTGDLTEAHYYRGDILALKLGKLEAGADEYMAVARGKPIGPLHRQALVNAIDAYARAAAAPGPIDDKLRAAAALYDQLFPNGPERVGIRYHLAQLAGDRGKTAEAVRIYTEIFDGAPTDPAAGPAADRALSVLNKAQDYEAIRTLAAHLLAHPAFAKPDQQERLKRLRSQASAKLAELAQAAGKHARAAELFERAAAEAVTPHEAATYGMNAGVAHEKAHRPELAIAAYKAAAARAPADPLAARALFAAALIAERYWRWPEAIALYEQVAASYPADAHAADALYNAAILQQAIGDRRAAIALLERYAKQFANRKDAPAVALAAAKLREDAGDRAGALAAYTAVVAAYRANPIAVDAHVGAARVAIALDRDTDATDHITAALATARADQRGPILLLRGRLAAHIAERLPLTGPSIQLALAQKAKAWAGADRAFVAVVESRDIPSIMAGLHEMAALRERELAIISTLPTPAKLTRDEQIAFEKELAQFATAIRASTIELYRTAYVKALQLDHHGTDTIAIRDALVRLGALPADPSARGDLRWDSGVEMPFAF